MENARERGLYKDDYFAGYDLDMTTDYPDYGPWCADDLSNLDGETVSLLYNEHCGFVGYVMDGGKYFYSGHAVADIVNKLYRMGYTF